MKITMQKKAFSLIESIAVMFIIVLVAAMTMPNYFQFASRKKLDTAARGVATALRTAREYAIANHRNYILFVDTDDNEYRISFMDAVNPNQEHVVEKTYHVPLGIDITDVSDQTGEVAITFTPAGNGTLSSIHILHADDFTAMLNAHPGGDFAGASADERQLCFTVTVAQNGRVRIFKYGINGPWPLGEM